MDLLYLSQMMYVCGELWWNDIDREKRKNSKKNLPHCHLVHHKPYMDWPGRKPGPPQ
jgi:hypothetical protein